MIKKIEIITNHPASGHQLVPVPKKNGFRPIYIHTYLNIQCNPTLVAPLFKGYPHLRDNTVWSRIFSGFSNVKKPLFLEPLFKGYSDLRDKFLKISLVSREIRGNFDEF